MLARMRAERAGHRRRRRIVGRRLRMAVLDLDVDAGRLGERQGALRALDGDAVGLDVEFDALGQVDRLSWRRGTWSLLP